LKAEAEAGWGQQFRIKFPSHNSESRLCDKLKMDSKKRQQIRRMDRLFSVRKLLTE